MDAAGSEQRAFLRHTVATLAYRGGKVVRDAPTAFGVAAAGGSSRNACAILAHVADLLNWAHHLARGSTGGQNSVPTSWPNEVERFFGELQELDAYLASEAPLACAPQRLFQGPIADALTHVGQLALLRRAAGRPVRGENYFVADIEVGRVGPQQATPRREFE